MRSEFVESLTKKAIYMVLVICKELFSFLEIVKLIQVLHDVMWCGTISTIGQLILYFV